MKTFTKGELEVILLAELKSLKRIDEKILTSCQDEISGCIASALRIHASHPEIPAPSEKQIARFRKTYQRHYGKDAAMHIPHLSSEHRAEFAARHRFAEKYGEALMLAIMAHRDANEKKTIIFLGAMAGEAWDMHKKGTLPFALAARWCRRHVRLVLGHERRHKQQFWLIGQGADELLLHARKGLSLSEALEEDAAWAAWSWNSACFGDPIIEIDS